MAPKAKLALAVFAAVAAVAGIGWYLVWAFSAMEGVELGWNGWLALALGVAATLALGLGLMRLVYLSNRRGYDERAAEKPDPGAERRPNRWER
jgi:hypothetical protein